MYFLRQSIRARPCAAPANANAYEGAVHDTLETFIERDASKQARREAVDLTGNCLFWLKQLLESCTYML